MGSATPIAWSDELLTGIAEIDQQHRILVDTLVEARGKLSDGGIEPLFDRITRDLLAYAIYHFTSEERLMQQEGYALAAPEAAARHLAAHRQFSQQMVALRADSSHDKRGARETLIRFLEEWLVDHIMTVDQELGRFLIAKR